MPLAVDSLVTDLMFKANAQIEQQQLLDALGGFEQNPDITMLDVDRLDPRMEMELSPSMPFRRRGERRLLVIDGSVAPMRKTPEDPVVPIDLRPAKEQLIAIADKVPLRLGRIFALGSWGDAVIVARSARDLRGVCLIPWALDPQVDQDGKRRATPLTQQEFEAKIMVFEKRLDELDEKEILAGLTGATFERRGELLVVDVLEPDGTWDLRRSLALETQLAAIERFSIIPGAPSAPGPGAPAQPKIVAPSAAPAKEKPRAGTTPGPAPAPAAGGEPKDVKKEEPKGPPLSFADVDGQVVLVFPPERFDLDVAAALGKRDWDAVVRRSDNLSGASRDKLQRDGGGWVAPLEFLSEVFVDGKPLSKPQFEANATALDGGARALEVHFPRFGPAVLVDVPGKGRYVSSLVDRAARVAQLVRG
jgi:hypothetical protein